MLRSAVGSAPYAQMIDCAVSNHLRGLFVKKRIWELDALRGLLILGMVLVHLVYDLQSFLGLTVLAESPIFDFILDWGGVLFFLLSGICVTLGHHPIRRGLIVLGCGLAVSAVTYGLYALNLAGKGMIIYFGVLHCLGVCMLLWPIFRRIPWPVTALLSVTIAVAGILIDPIRFDSNMLWMPLGLKPKGFVSSDYFALFPFLGFFLMGAILGKFAYKNKTTLIPKVNPENPLISFLSRMGRWSLPVYLLHQPVLTGLVMLLEVIK